MLLPKRLRVILALLCAVSALALFIYRIRHTARVDFRLAERSVFSGGGEDGVLEKIFTLIRPTHRFLVDLGAGDGIRGSSSRNLIANDGWGGLLLESRAEPGLALTENCRQFPRAKAIQAAIDPGDIEIILEKHRVPHDLDLLVVGLRANDWYVWRAIYDFRPKVVQIQYNAAFVPPQTMVIEYHPFNYWDGSVYFGASMQSLYDLGKRKGYELIYADQSGTSLFFVEKKFFDRFGAGNNSPIALYRRCATLPLIPPSVVRDVLGVGGVLLEQRDGALDGKAVRVPRRYVLDEL